ncbi:hypothetical protein DIZ27_28970 [Streptomyces sp. NWU339]|nr:hypothetical protein DIZ27_28970 [Streptomyces sp. NWU339]
MCRGLAVPAARPCHGPLVVRLRTRGVVGLDGRPPRAFGGFRLRVRRRLRFRLRYVLLVRRLRGGGGLRAGAEGLDRGAAPRAGEGAVEVPSARVAIVHDGGRLGSARVRSIGRGVKVW